MNLIDPTGMNSCPGGENSDTCLSVNPGIDTSEIVRDDDVAGNSAIDQAARDSLPKIANNNNLERAGEFVDDDGTVVFNEAEVTHKIRKKHKGRGQIETTVETNILNPSGDAVAVRHSHPDQGGSIVPGPGDNEVLDKHGVPNYIYHNGSIIVLERVGGEYRARVVEGSFNGNPGQISKRLRNFQRKR